MKTTLALFALSSFAPVFAQATILVPQQQPTIQAGIAAAVNGDTVLVAPGTYVEQVDLLGKAVTLVSAGGAAATTIDSQGMQLWGDFPFGAVVRMINGETSATVVEGFTITGGRSVAGLAGSSGVYCSGLTPYLRDCVITGNSGGVGGGILGDPLLERCTIDGNDALPYGDGGGIHGAPTMLDCIVTNNHSGGLGGGIYATGPCTIAGTVIDSNIGGNGADGYSGGGTFGPVTLVDCLITRNTAHHYFSGGPPDEIGTGVDGAVALRGCTVADNLIAGGPVAGEASGGVRNVGTIVDSILWNNAGNQVALGSTPVITYSIVEGGYPGTGNLTADPLFRDAATGDYFLGLGSPAIDAGDPASALDPDGTRRDMGALPFPQFVATWTARNGTGVNPLCFTTLANPVIGAGWSGTVDATLHGFPAALTVVLAYSQAASPLATAFGEVLVDPTSVLLVTSIVPPSSGQAAHPIAIPPDYSLSGLTVPTQAAVLGSSAGLCNALDLALGL